MSRRDAFAAISDPTRRQILDLLNARGTLPAGAIASHFGDASRPGISRHLRVLRDCRLVEVRQDGKSQLYTLRPGPLRRMREGWLAKFGDMQRDSLKALRKIVEEGEPC